MSRVTPNVLTARAMTHSKKIIDMWSYPSGYSDTVYWRSALLCPLIKLQITFSDFKRTCNCKDFLRQHSRIWGHWCSFLVVRKTNFISELNVSLNWAWFLQKKTLPLLFLTKYAINIYISGSMSWQHDKKFQPEVCHYCLTIKWAYK